MARLSDRATDEPLDPRGDGRGGASEARGRRGVDPNTEAGTAVAEAGGRLLGGGRGRIAIGNLPEARSHVGLIGDKAAVYASNSRPYRVPEEAGEPGGRDRGAAGWDGLKRHVTDAGAIAGRAGRSQG